LEETTSAILNAHGGAGVPCELPRSRPTGLWWVIRRACARYDACAQELTNDFESGPGATPFVSIPVTQVTFYTADMGNTCASDGFRAHSS